MSTIAEFQPQFIDEEEDEQELMIQFEDNAFEPASPVYQEDFEDQVHVAQEQLAELREKQELLERQKTELEELSQQKEEFTEGRARIIEDLKSYVSGLESEAGEAQRLADECLDNKEIFEHHMRTVQCLRPESWARADLKGELSRAISYIDLAEEDIAKVSPLLNSLGGKKKIFKTAAAAATTSTSSSQPFSYWLKAGLAFTIPIMIFAVIMSVMMALFGG